MTPSTPVWSALSRSARTGIAAAAGAVLALACSGAKKSEVPPVPVVTATAKVQPVSMSLLTVGSVEPIESVAVKAQISGVITRAGFAEGEDVKAGQLLFQIDSRPLAAALEAAAAQLAKDSAQAANAQTQAARYERLVAKDFVTKEQYDAARTQADVFKSAVLADSAAVEQAKLNLAYASITAPIAGRTGSILLKKGNLAKANDLPLVVINQLRPIRVTFAIPGSQLPLVQKFAAQAPLQVLVRPTRDGTGVEMKGRLSFVDNSVDPGTGTVTLKAEFANDEGLLWPGQFVDAELVLTVEPAAMTVPAAAVVTGQQGPFVFVIGADGKAEKRAVKVNRTVGGTTVLDEGLQTGETVVVDGQMRLVPGAVVQVKTDPAQQGGAR
jgi:multidrug efflux system membrane fusion protein